MNGEMQTTCSRCRVLRRRLDDTLTALRYAQHCPDIEVVLEAAEAHQIAGATFQIHQDTRHGPAGHVADGDILDAYTWTRGDCTMCDSISVPTTRVGTHISRYSHRMVPLILCQPCTLRIELGNRGLSCGADRYPLSAFT